MATIHHIINRKRYKIRHLQVNGVGRLRQNEARRGFAVDGEMEGADVNGVLQLPLK